MSLLDLIGLNRIFKAGLPVNPTRKILNFIGDGVTIADNPANERTDITITGGGGGGGAGTITGPGTTVDGHVSTWVGTDGTELADSGLALASVATEAYVDAAVAGVSAGSGDVVGPASAIADRIALFNGTSGKAIKDGGATIAQLGAITARYQGGSFTPNTMSYPSATWAGLMATVSSGTWTDEVTTNISRSGENFTVALAGVYSIRAWFPSYTPGTPPLRGTRCLVNGVMRLSMLSYGGGPAGTVTDTPLEGFLALAASDVVTFEYVNITGSTSFGAFTSGQMAGVNIKTAQIDIVRIGA